MSPNRPIRRHGRRGLPAPANVLARHRTSAIGAAIGALVALAAVLGVAFGATGGGAPAPAGAAAAAQPNPNCTLSVPAAPTSAAGLATPYQLTATDPAQGPCHEADVNQSAFVQATAVDPATGAVSVYDPLVVDAGTQPAAAPVTPKLPAGAVVGIWFGFNGTTLRLSGAGARSCVNGTGSPFGQFAYCNAPAFFSAANQAEAAGRLAVPPLGTAKDGQPCLTTRDFGLVDQDQSDNVTTEYLATANGRTAQNTPAGAQAAGTGAPLLNGSDNLLLDAFVDPALGCTPWTAPDLAVPGNKLTSLALDELQAAKDQAAPTALVPMNDPMVLTANGGFSATKTNLYRSGVDQRRLSAADNGSPTLYCSRLASLGPKRINADRQFTVGAPSPTAGMNLFDFLTQRLAASLTNLKCPQAAAPSAASPSGSPTVSAPASSASASAPAAGGTATPSMPGSTQAGAPTSAVPATSAPGAAPSSAPATAAPSASASVTSRPPAGPGGGPGGGSASRAPR
ncbi:hypothetical protein [Phaeacidiphilus oryzae]|uniref:hypothetical protein n=1 Tax=Phaeacidiphilus oryzae TaxID=348818 RepID=UPI0007C63604|nr:hypothetical protein [Phaeacidiphilus oryzae]